MVKIVEVKTRKQQKQFVMFQLKLYKDCPYFVPPIISDELSMFSPKKNANYEDCETVYYLAYKDDKIVGRIAGIIQGASNKKMNQKYARFSRVDFINDREVAKALFDAVEKWAKEKGMDHVHGPLGFNDLEREGLLIEGFDQMSCFEENYYYSYYKDIIDSLGYKKDVDWLEFRIKVPKEKNERAERLAQLLEKRYKLSIVPIKSKSKLIKEYRDQIFALLNECYGPLYGVVPITKKLEDQFAAQFKLIISKKLVCLVQNEKKELVGFGLVFPSMSEAMRATKGRIFCLKTYKLIHALLHPKEIDMALIAVRPDYRTKGVTAFIFNYIQTNMREMGVEYAETMLQLENNIAIQNQFEEFNGVNHKRRRCYIEEI